MYADLLEWGQKNIQPYTPSAASDNRFTTDMNISDEKELEAPHRRIKLPKLKLSGLGERSQDKSTAHTQIIQDAILTPDFGSEESKSQRDPEEL